MRFCARLGDIEGDKMKTIVVDKKILRRDLPGRRFVQVYPYPVSGFSAPRSEPMNFDCVIGQNKLKNHDYTHEPRSR